MEQPVKKATDPTLIEAIKAMLARALSQRTASDLASWERFYELYNKIIAAYCRREGLSPQEIEDFIQQAWCEVLRDLHGFHHPGVVGSFRAWLKQLIHHNALDQYDKQAPKSVTPDVLDRAVQTPLELTAEAILERHENRRRWDRALVKLEETCNPRDYKMFIRRYMDGRRHDQIAREFKLKPDVVRQAVGRVMTKFREIIRIDFGDERPAF